MNFKQGFFRIWVVASVLWIGAVGAFSYETISSEFEKDGHDWSKAGILFSAG